jgi:hypothetical protein
VDSAGSGRQGQQRNDVGRSAPLIAQTRASSWTTFAAVAPTRASTWVTFAAVVKAPSATTWVTRATVSLTRASTWNVIGPIAASRSHDLGHGRCGLHNPCHHVGSAHRHRQGDQCDHLGRPCSRRHRPGRQRGPPTPQSSPSAATTWLTATSTITNRATTWTALAAITRTRATTWDVAGPGAYRVFDPTSPPSIGRPSDTAAVDVGTEFYVTDTATVTDLHYLHVNDAAASLATRTLALYDMTTASFVAQVDVTPTSADQGKWVAGHLSTPYSLVINRHYKAVTFHPAGDYALTTHYFDTGTGASGLTSGPIVVPNAASATSPGQGTFRYASSLTNTDSQFNSANYWNDVTVSVPVAGAVIVTRPTTWAVTAAITASRGSTWQTSTTATTTRATTWAALAAVPSTRPSTWVTYAAVAKTSATTWNVVGPIAATRSTTWHVLAAVSVTRGSTWQTSTTAAKTVLNDMGGACSGQPHLAPPRGTLSARSKPPARRRGSPAPLSPPQSAPHGRPPQPSPNRPRRHGPPVPTLPPRPEQLRGWCWRASSQPGQRRGLPAPTSPPQPAPPRGRSPFPSPRLPAQQRGPSP